MMDRSATPRLTAEQVARFKRLAAPHLAVLLRTSMYLTHHDQLAEDLVQETMMKAMRAIDSFQEGTDIKAWLMTILGCTHIDIVRSNKLHAHTVSIEQTEIELADPRQDDGGKYDDRWNEPAALLERFGDREVIEALHWLPEEIRRTFLLMDVEQMDHSAAATILKVPVGTIKSGANGDGGGEGKTPEKPGDSASTEIGGGRGQHPGVAAGEARVRRAVQGDENRIVLRSGQGASSCVRD